MGALRASPLITASRAIGHPEWYAVKTRHRCERMVVDHLSRVHFETFLPVHEEIHNWSDRKKKITVPMFPGYVFVRIRLSEARLPVLQTPGVRRFVMFNGTVARIEPNQIEAVRLVTERNVPCSVGPSLPLGTRVRIQGGVLHGLEGTLSQTSRETVIITIEPLQRSITIDASGYSIVAI